MTTQAAPIQRGVTAWLTGLPSSGKSTLATAVAERLAAEGHRVQVLDGDEMRRVLSAGLGFSKKDRNTNVRRIGFVAQLLAAHGVKVLVPVIAPYADARAEVKARHVADGTAYLEIHIAAPTEVCATRDVKGLYAKHAAGQLSGLTGMDDPYESPLDPDMRLLTHEQSVAESADALYALLKDRGFA